ncbi:hypothetical protein ZWY2020_051967 [Hordeum vulgare]|nr:hypothetical protein ZWY2020_051967 [Hordeum vulgare]
MRIGPNMDYVGGEEAMSEIERDKLSLQEVKDVYVEYHGEEDNDSSIGSDYEDEIIEESDNCSGDEPDEVITAVEPAESDTDVLIPDETGVITQRHCSPMKQRRSSIGQVGVDHDEMRIIEDSDSDNDSEYIGHTDDSGED